ncbi:SMI1/KNR4 family protein [Paenibacillus sp. MMS18-CY102]|uniref:SMI1/KNR4 family protein n=1 Tax=Paenibacillus sp. MMS18-CY102 TaxID=2682849 RepID=UPI00136590C1|nr:SMI1/KNR4 family protein [Paenibacillus sp. MMS18-CY102]MWC29776.1 SMI1/KNR4 family protein [Paenibacillus sp. MMS18-CY102]
MEGEDYVNLTLEGLKQRLSSHGTLICQANRGYVFEASFEFYEPASQDRIDSFLKSTNWIIPADYRSFLEIHNGAKLFEDSFGTSFKLFSLAEIQAYHTDYMPDDCYAIGMQAGMGTLLMIDSTAVRNGSEEYLSWFEAGEFHPVKSNFQLWFDRLVMAQGTVYWGWNIFQNR